MANDKNVEEIRGNLESIDCASFDDISNLKIYPNESVNAVVELDSLGEVNRYVEGNFDIRLGSAFDLIKSLQDSSVHFVAIDPPYFIDGMGAEWDREKLDTKAARGKVVTGLPVGMQFSPQQGRDFQKFLAPFAKEAMRVLKPGGFLVSFSQARLYHRMAVSFEDAGFEIRDMMAWKYSGQAKAFSMDHIIKKNKDYSDKKKAELIKSLEGWKTPQLRPQMEPIVLAQKPRQGTFVENWMLHQTGLLNTTIRLDEKFPGNVLEVSKPSKKEKGLENVHMTVKPVLLMEHLIELFTTKDQVILDAFMGSGTTGVAAVGLKRKFIGFEIDKEYFKISHQRISGVRNGGK